eukprot:12908687-Prorocentrum_lima.AAC.1
MTAGIVLGETDTNSSNGMCGDVLSLFEPSYAASVHVARKNVATLVCNNFDVSHAGFRLRSAGC